MNHPDTLSASCHFWSSVNAESVSVVNLNLVKLFSRQGFTLFWGKILRNSLLGKRWENMSNILESENFMFSGSSRMWRRTKVFIASFVSESYWILLFVYKLYLLSNTQDDIYPRIRFTLLRLNWIVNKKIQKMHTLGKDRLRTLTAVPHVPGAGRVNWMRTSIDQPVVSVANIHGYNIFFSLVYITTEIYVERLVCSSV